MNRYPTCPLCLIPYNLRNRGPMSFQCGHTICEVCLDKLRQDANNELQDLRCPFDRGVVTNTARNYAMIDIISDLSLESAPTLQPPVQALRVPFQESRLYGGPCNVLSFNILVVGAQSVGKSTLIQCMKSLMEHREMPQLQPVTIGFDFSTIECAYNTSKVRLRVFDTTGQDRFHNLTPNQYRTSNLVLLVFDLTNINSLHVLRDRYLDQINQTAPTVKLTLVGTKLDLNRSEVHLQLVNLILNQYGISSYHEVSSKSGQNVRQLGEDVVRSLAEMEIMSMIRAESFSLVAGGLQEGTSSTQRLAKKKKRCC